MKWGGGGGLSSVLKTIEGVRVSGGGSSRIQWEAVLVGLIFSWKRGFTACIPLSHGAGSSSSGNFLSI